MFTFKYIFKKSINNNTKLLKYKIYLLMNLKNHKKSN